MNLTFFIIFIFAILFLLFVGFLFLVLTILKKSYESVSPKEHHHKNAQEEVHLKQRNPLFRHLPTLSSKLAWKELGEFPTKIHKVQIPSHKGQPLTFWMKREDLSSGAYGGNKVRTMQYTLALCEMYARENPNTQFFVMGSGGSNQVLASLVHGSQLKVPFHVRYPIHDEPDLDNTLNLLSTLSLDPLSIKCWNSGFSILWEFTKSLVLNPKGTVVIGPGGNSVPGALGQIGAAIELAEQIAAGIVPDPDAIYLPMGSSCTTTGLIIGICLARHLGIPAFRSRRFKLVSVAVDGKMAFLHRWTNVMYSKLFSSFLPITPLFGIPRICSYLNKATNGELDLEGPAIKFLNTEWEYVSDPDYVGKYGTHSKKSKEAINREANMEITGELPDWMKESKRTQSQLPPLPWLCGHFAAKSFAVLLDRLELKKDGENVLLWQTKSHVLPRGEKDEWCMFKEMVNASRIPKKWVEDGKATSTLRPGKVDWKRGEPGDYRHIMTELRFTEAMPKA